MVEHAIGFRIRRLRKERGMTQQQLADVVGVSQRQVLQWEKGYTVAPSEENMEKLATIFNVTASYLYAGEAASDSIREEIQGELASRRSKATFGKVITEDEVIPVRMSSSVEKRLHRAAAREGVSVGQFIEYLLDQYEGRSTNGATEEE
jgi:transcriptional regulator with XRE-family HTH domain